MQEGTGVEEADLASGRSSLGVFEGERVSAAPHFACGFVFVRRISRQIRLLEDQHRSFTICSSSSSSSSPPPSDMKSTTTGSRSLVPSTSTSSSCVPGSYEQLRLLQQELAAAEKDRTRLLALEQQREKEKLQLVDLFSLQSMRVRELEQQLLHIDDQLAKVLSQVGPCPLQHQPASGSMQQCAQGRARDRESATQRRGERSRTRSEHRSEGEEKADKYHSSALPAVQSVPCLNREKQFQPGAVVLHSAALQRLQGMRATLKRVQEQLPAVVAHDLSSSPRQAGVHHPPPSTAEAKAAALSRGFSPPSSQQRSLLAISTAAAEAPLFDTHDQRRQGAGQLHFAYGGFKGAAAGQQQSRSEPRSCSPHGRAPGQRLQLSEARGNNIDTYHYSMSKCGAFHFSDEKTSRAANSRKPAAATAGGAGGCVSSRGMVPGTGSVLVPSMKSRQPQAVQVTRHHLQGGVVTYRYATPSRLQQHTQLLDGSEVASVSRAAAGTSPFRQPLCHRGSPQ